MKQRRIAIIGGGIFGVTAALEFARFGDVVLYEKNEQLMGEGTYANQYRHHFGYHYPRSIETVRQCAAATKDFEGVWGAAIRRDFPAYYAVAKDGSKTSPEQFLDFCRNQELPFVEAYPPEEFLNRSAVALCVKTPEPVYDYPLLRRMAHDLIKANASISLRVGHEVAGARIGAGGEKILSTTHKGVVSEGVFDVVVNATYANYNLLPSWFGFPTKEIEFRLKEIVAVRLPARERIGVMVLDGPFVTILPLSGAGEFTLGDAPRSIHEVRVSAGGIPWTKSYIAEVRSRFREMQAHNPFFIPIIAKAEYVRSMFAVLPALPAAAATDARPTIVTDHGHQCFSVFEGKIITCVTAAKDIARRLNLTE